MIIITLIINCITIIIQFMINILYYFLEIYKDI